MLIGLSGPRARYSKGPVTFRVQLNSSTVRFWFVNGQFHIVIFKIIEALILNANTANIKQLFGPEKLSGLSRHRSLALKDKGSVKLFDI